MHIKEMTVDKFHKELKRNCKHYSSSLKVENNGEAVCQDCERRFFTGFMHDEIYRRKDAVEQILALDVSSTRTKLNKMTDDEVKSTYRGLTFTPFNNVVQIDNCKHGDLRVATGQAKVFCRDCGHAFSKNFMLKQLEKESKSIPDDTMRGLFIKGVKNLLS